MNLAQMLTRGPVLKARPKNKQRLREYVEQEYLRAMPDRVFYSSELAEALGIETKRAAQYLRRFESRGLVECLGPDIRTYRMPLRWQKKVAA